MISSQITPEQNKRLRKYLKIIGLGVMITYVSVGVFAIMILPEGDLKTHYETLDDQYYSFIKDAFADKSTEGHIYVIEISDHVAASEILR